MNDQHRKDEKKGEARKQPHDQRERTVAPPIEREHETQQGVFEEDEKRESEHERH